MADDAPNPRIFEGEEWRPVPSLDGRWLVSNLGRVRGPTGRVLALKRRKAGYMLFSVRRDGKSGNASVARAVCEAFHGPPACGDQVDHIDRRRDNDVPSNLRWVTKAENLAHRQNRYGTEHHNSRLTAEAVREIRASTARTADLASTYAVAPRTIRDARSGKLWRHVHAS